MYLDNIYTVFNFFTWYVLDNINYFRRMEVYIQLSSFISLRITF